MLKLDPFLRSHFPSYLARSACGTQPRGAVVHSSGRRLDPRRDTTGEPVQESVREPVQRWVGRCGF
jgi:hypothetical protein